MYDDNLDNFTEACEKLRSWMGDRKARRVLDPQEVQPGMNIYVMFLSASQKNMYAVLPSWGVVTEVGDVLEEVQVQDEASGESQLLIKPYYTNCKGLSYDVYVVEEAT